MLAILPRILASVGGVLLTVLGSFWGRLIAALGFTVVSYSGISVTLDWFHNNMINALNAIPSDIIGLLAYMKVGICINIIITAITLRLTIKGVTGGTLRKWILKK